MRVRTLPRLTIALALGAALASPGGAGELIRYRGADGRVGFTGDPSGVPEGAVVLNRRPSSDSGGRRSGTAVPSVADLNDALRDYCEGRWSRDRGMLEHCVASQGRAALRYRDLMLAHPPGSQGRAMVAGCNRSSGHGSGRDFTRIVACAEDARSKFLQRHGSDPASLDRMAEPDRPTARPREQQGPNDRLQRLREEQERADRELEKGRRKWGPRYRKARRELDQAEAKTRSIEERMRHRGCRTDTLACGGLGKKLEHARRVEAEKRDYLSNRLVDECRRAGCQPGWLR
jgi:hypothetical protein